MRAGMRSASLTRRWSAPDMPPTGRRESGHAASMARSARRRAPRSRGGAEALIVIDAVPPRACKLGAVADPNHADLIAAVRAALEPVDDIGVAYVFGSRVAGREHAGSDLDIGVRMQAGLSSAAREAVRRRVVGALTDALGAIGERADLVDLDRADPAVAF